MSKRDWIQTKKQQNMYQNLWRQAEKIFNWKTHHQGKRGTERYRDGVRAFCKHLAVQYNSKNFKNISDKHLESFVKSSSESGVGASTIKTDLAAVRKLHSLLPKTRYQLSTNNKMLGAENRKLTGVDRAWRNTEAKKAVDLAHSMGRKDIEWAIRCGRTMGLRLEEVTALTKSQGREALTNGYIRLTNTKGGIPRNVPLNSGSERVLREMVTEATSEKIFIKHGRTHEQAMKSIKNWVGNHREQFMEPYSPDKNYHEQMMIDTERPNLTFHGLRHAYARSEYQSRVNGGVNAQQARQDVAEQLGHGRDNVTRVYIG